MPLSRLPVALRLPAKSTVPAVRPLTSAILPVVFLVMEAPTVTLALPPLIRTPWAAGSLVLPMLPPPPLTPIVTALVLPLIEAPAPVVPLIATELNVTTPLAPERLMPLASVLAMVAPVNPNAADEPVIEMPSLLAPLVPAIVTAPPLKVPPATVLNEMASAATVPVAPRLAKATPPAPTVTPDQSRILPVVVVTLLPLPVTLMVPPPLARKPVPLVVSTSSPPPVKFTVAPVLLASEIAVFAPVLTTLWAPEKLTVPAVLSWTEMPVPPVMSIAPVKLPAPTPAPRPVTSIEPPAVLAMLLAMLTAAWPPLITTSVPAAPLM